MSHTSHEPTTITDERGNRVVLVPLSLNRGYAKVDEADYFALRSKGYVGGWYLNDQRGTCYVMLNGKDQNNKYASRLIMSPPKGYVVRYRNNDRKDLRRSNLVLQSRKSLKKNLGDTHV